MNIEVEEDLDVSHIYQVQRTNEKEYALLYETIEYKNNTE